MRARGFLTLTCLAVALPAAGLALVTALGTDVTVHLGVARVSVREPVRPGSAAIGALVLALLVGGRSGASDARRILRAHADRVALACALLLAAAATAVGLAFGTNVAGGADSYGYLSQATLWRAGTLEVEQPLASEVPWTRQTWTFAPLGYRPALTPGFIVPVYAPGLPLLMAAFMAVGGEQAKFLVVPLCGALLVLAGFFVGRSLGGPIAGIWSALLTLTCPPVLVQLVQPMSDVSAAALWGVAFACALRPTTARAAWTGVAAAGAVLVRPNLAPLAMVLAAMLVRCPGGEPRESIWRRGRRLLAFGVPLAAAAGWIAALNARLYGSPFRSGYGTAGDLFSTTNILPNLALYSTWLREALSALVLVVLAVGVVAALIVASPAPRRRAAWALAFALAVLVAYLPYAQFENWTYLRFLLPGMPLVFATAGSGLVVLARRACGRYAGIVVLAVGTVIAADWLASARVAGAFINYRNEQRYVTVAEFVRDTWSRPVAFAVQHSGSLRYYGGVVSVRYDWLEPQWLEPGVKWLASHAYRPVFVLEQWEADQFRARFGSESELGRLDWVPRAETLGGGTVLVFDPADRSRRGPEQLLPPWTMRHGETAR